MSTQRKGWDPSPRILFAPFQPILQGEPFVHSRKFIAANCIVSLSCSKPSFSSLSLPSRKWVPHLNSYFLEHLSAPPPPQFLPKVPHACLCLNIIFGGNHPPSPRQVWQAIGCFPTGMWACGQRPPLSWSSTELPQISTHNSCSTNVWGSETSRENGVSRLGPLPEHRTSHSGCPSPPGGSRQNDTSGPQDHKEGSI